MCNRCRRRQAVGGRLWCGHRLCPPCLHEHGRAYCPNPIPFDPDGLFPRPTRPGGDPDGIFP